MPLNPNGKIDKPALAFPDTAQAAAAVPSTSTSTVDTLRTIWASILPSAPQPIPTDESFFDLGGHSILATRLIFEIRKAFVIDAPLGLVFDEPTIGGLVQAIESMRKSDLGFTFTAPDSEQSKTAVAAVEYSHDYETLVGELRESYPELPKDFYDKAVTVFLTGATGFLGAFILHSLMSQTRVKKVICLVRAADDIAALERLRAGSTDRGVWGEDWATNGRLAVVVGDLGLKKFGIDDAKWNAIAAEADIVLHNGALVRLNHLLYCCSERRIRCIGYTHTTNSVVRTLLRR